MKKLMVTKNPVVKIQNLVLKHESGPVKSNIISLCKQRIWFITIFVNWI